jgi:hypothetical protein
MKLSRLTGALITSLGRQSHIIPEEGGDKITISRTVSALAVLYERMRVAMEYREDHLLRRAAIERILKRRLLLNENGQGVAENIIKELLWAQYAPENSVSVRMIQSVQITIDKYIFLRNDMAQGRRGKEYAFIHEWLISTCAAEIEEKLAPNPRREAFINFIFQYYKDKVYLRDENDQTKDIQVYIAVHRAFAKSDNDFIRYELLKLSYPHIVSKNWMDLREDTGKIYTLLQDFNTHLMHKIGLKLARSLKKEVAPFLILRDIYVSRPMDFKDILEDENKLEHNIDLICRQRYEDIGKKLQRAGIRSIIYIFLTKMVFAIALEFPFEHYVLGEINLTALSVNTIFPPFLMFIALLGNAPPGQENTSRVIARIKEIIYKELSTEKQITLTLKTPKRRPILNLAFTVLYSFAFLLVFGTIVATLTYFRFNIASQIIFLFFVTVVLFFAYRVRQLGREYVLRRRESLFSPIINFFLLPILNVGKALSNEIARFNVLIAFFDFVIEAPFKAIFEIFEEWFSFMRSKKEEII